MARIRQCVLEQRKYIQIHVSLLGLSFAWGGARRGCAHNNINYPISNYLSLFFVNFGQSIIFRVTMIGKIHRASYFSIFLDLGYILFI